MEFLLTQTSIILLFGGFVLGVMGVIVGGTMFFGLPLFQWLFPEAAFGSIVGNYKFGALTRGIGATISMIKKIDWKECFLISIFPFIATIIGASLIAGLDQKWIFPAVIVAVLLAELAPRVAHLINRKTFFASAFLSGIYAGIFGAGISIMLIGLLRTKHPKDEEIAYVKIQVNFIELLLTITAVVTHYFHHNLVTEIWVPWSIGTFFGGMFGGVLLHHIGHLKGAYQKIILHIAFALALIVAGIKFFQS